MEKSVKLLKGWKVILTLFLVTMFCEKIGSITIPIGSVSIVLLPLLFSMIIGLILALLKPVTWINESYGDISNDFVVIGIALFMSKTAINCGEQLIEVVTAGPALILQELGNMGTIFFALPMALLLGFGRETIGMVHSIAREGNVAFVAAECGTLDCPEGRGVMTVYFGGTLLGGIFMSVLSSVIASLHIFHPYALGMACGVGSGSMLMAALAPLTSLFPDMADQITAYAGMSNVLSNCDGIIMTILVYWPLTKFLFRKLYPIIGRGRKERKLQQIQTENSKGEDK